ncbi:MAG: hypothetical protein JWO97_3655 [Acidobacteria bacterium]|nr:hypothetical protein [Acidobacteriota bacterium]
MRRLALVAALLTATTLGAAFKSERMIHPGAKGPNRLVPDVALLANAKPLRYAAKLQFEGGLDDLRLYDAAGAEVSYLLLAPTVAEETWRGATVLPVAPTKTTSAFEADLGAATLVDRLRINGIATPFLKRARLEGSGDRAHWTVLADDTTVFDLPDEELRNVEIAFAPGTYRYLRVTWDDRASARVRAIGSVEARVRSDAVPTERVRVPVAYRVRASEPGKSRYRILLPGSHLPVEAIELNVANGNVFRDATITEGRLTDGEIEQLPLGNAKLRRAERDGAVAAQLAIPITFPQGAELELTVDDANNPPLQLAGIVAQLSPLPSIYFESADGAPLTAHFGDSKREAPHYDLEASRKFAMKGAAAIATWATSDAKQLAGGDEQEQIPTAGAPLTPDAFRYRRSVAPAARALTSLLLDADVLSRSNALADVRLVDAGDRQVPYVVETRPDPLKLALTIEPPRRDGSTSIYRFRLPYATLPEGTVLALTTSARVFERHVTVRADRGDEARDNPRMLDDMWWRSTDASSAAPALLCTCSLRGVRAVEIVVDEGDNAPLPIKSAELLISSRALRFFHPGGPLRLLYGNPAASAPRYDLSLLAPRLFEQPANEIALRPMQKAAGGEEKSREPWVFGVIIAVAVIALLAVIAALVRERPVSEDAPR